MPLYNVCFEVRYGPSGSGASWMEENDVIEADSPREARNKFRARQEFLPNGRGWYEVGKHISTELVKEG